MHYWQPPPSGRTVWGIDARLANDLRLSCDGAAPTLFPHAIKAVRA